LRKAMFRVGWRADRSLQSGIGLIPARFTG